MCMYCVYIEVESLIIVYNYYMFDGAGATHVPWCTHRGHGVTLWCQFFPSLFACVPGMEVRPSDLPDKCFFLQLSHQSKLLLLFF